MNKHNNTLALLGGLLLAAGTAGAGVVKTEGSDVILTTNGGFGVKTEDGQFAFNIEGRLNWDTAVYDGVFNAGKAGKTGNDTYIRRGYFGVTGTASKDWQFEMILNAVGDQGASTIEWDTAFVAYTGWAPATVTAGRARRPFGLEAMTSSAWVSTIERSAIWELTPVEDTPVGALLMLGNGGARHSWAVAVYDDGKETTAMADRNGATARFTWSPVAEKTRVVHLGLSLAEDNDNSAVTRSRLGVRPGDRHVFVPVTTSEGDTSAVLEAAWMSGPFSLQGEYLARRINGSAGSADADVSGYYLQGTWTLTGESRGYKAKAGKFDRVAPAGAGGAWELVARLEHLAGQQTALPERDADIALVGINWYANRNVKLALNVQQVETGNLVGAGVDTEGDSATMRLQYNF